MTTNTLDDPTAITTLRGMIQTQRAIIRLIRQAQGAVNAGAWAASEERLAAALMHVQALREAGDR